jgi:hypothetical protein
VHTWGGVFHTINRVIHRCLWIEALAGPVEDAYGHRTRWVASVIIVGGGF